MSIQSNPEATGSTTDMQQLVQQTEVMQAQLALKLQFQKNMAFFKQHKPDIYKEYCHYTPCDQKLFYDTAGYINLLNIGSQKPAFTQNPIEFAQAQVDSFLQSPTRLTLGFTSMNAWNDKHIHLKLTGDALDAYQAMAMDEHYTEGSPLGLVVIIGCGLGHHITNLLERGDIYNLFIYDGNKDSFFASLYTTDWQAIITHIVDKGGKIRLLVGFNYFKALSDMRSFSREIGLFNLTKTYIFTHTKSRDNDLFFEKYRKDFHLNATGIGFFDDEQISFAHTIANLKQQLPIFNPTQATHTSDLPPLLLIGNGPSLDSLAEIISEHQDKAIIMSCGTAISSLYNMGIKPDIHVEMERGLTTSQWIKLGTDKNYTRDITLLALNNVSPETVKLFKRALISIKPNDIGGSVIFRETSAIHHYELPMCNPTATNCGLSYAIQLGFKDIYLMGTDYGMKDKTSHHSKHSIYHSLDEKREKSDIDPSKKGKDYTYSQGQYAIKGNFCDEVLTINSLDMSRRNIEILLDVNTDIRCYNPNDGAMIRGATPTLIQDITLAQSPVCTAKPTLIDTLLNSHFHTPKVRKLTKHYIEEHYLSLLFKVKEGFVLPEQCDDIHDLYHHIKRIFNNLKNVEHVDKTTAMLIFGSTQMHLGLLYSHCSNTQTPEQFACAYRIGQTHYTQMIQQIMHVIKTDPLRLDDSVIQNIPASR